MSNCVICSANSAPYKCPKCRIKYCSQNCFKSHQEKGCEEIKAEETIQEDNTNYNYITEDTISPAKIKLLDDSGELKNILSNSHVRDILLEIDKSPNASEIMDKAMKEPIFVEFADVCLKLVQDQKKLNTE